LSIISSINRKKSAHHPSIDKLKKAVVKALKDDKSINVVAIDLEGKADFAHYMIIATGRSSRHINSLGDKVADQLIASGLANVNVEGSEKGEWVLIDGFDIVVHLFKEDTRATYDLESMWGFEVK
jgi:ribosome-associated protein